ncbi:hypothetical protein MRB53_012822 [Persea americana]|uniref:Uncharacterized protein n=1 Tax=Persea americana TaxID=3435 RepID=A0ACC2LYR6_PERAE|nr:hypothetical protein MRB53_012822 [Persea americana]
MHEEKVSPFSVAERKKAEEVRGGVGMVLDCSDEDVGRSWFWRGRCCADARTTPERTLLLGDWCQGQGFELGLDLAGRGLGIWGISELGGQKGFVGGWRLD